MATPHSLLFDLVRAEPISGPELTPDVVRSAQEHRLVGPLARLVQGTMDLSVARQLTGAEMFEEAHRGRVLGKAAEVHQRLGDAGIRHLFMKGTVEGTRLFADPVDRRFMDVDVVIHPDESLGAAVSTLVPGHPDAANLDDLVRRRHRSSIGFYLDGVPVDLHTDALRNASNSVDPGAWWDRVVEVEVPAIGTVEALDLNASTLLFLIHQARDRFRYLNGVWEFRHRVLAGPDWDDIEKLARIEGIWEQVAVAAEVMAETAGLAPPVLVPENWRARLWRRMWAPKVRFLGEEGRARFNRRGQWLMPMTSRGRFGESISWIGRSAFPPDVLLRRKHPNARGPYLWRVVSSRVEVVASRRWRTLSRSIRGRWGS